MPDKLPPFRQSNVPPRERCSKNRLIEGLKNGKEPVVFTSQT